MIKLTFSLSLKSFTNTLEKYNFVKVLYDFMDSLLTEAVNKYINNSDKVEPFISIKMWLTFQNVNFQIIFIAKAVMELFHN